jgi:hypothetical protein
LPFIVLFFAKNIFEISKNVIHGFYLVFGINFVFSLAFVFAEENRIFALPFLLIFPILGKLFYSIIQENFIKLDVKITALAIVFSGLSYFCLKYLYQFTSINYKDNFFVEYNTVSIFLLFYFFLKRLLPKKTGVKNRLKD